MLMLWYCWPYAISMDSIEYIWGRAVAVVVVIMVVICLNVVLHYYLAVIEAIYCSLEATICKSLFLFALGQFTSKKFKSETRLAWLQSYRSWSTPNRYCNATIWISCYLYPVFNARIIYQNQTSNTLNFCHGFFFILIDNIFVLCAILKVTLTRK